MIMLLVQYILPGRLAQRGVAEVISLGLLPLAAWALPRPWVGLTALLIFGPFGAAVRFAGASNLQSLFKDLFAVALVLVWLLDALLSRRRLERSPLDMLLIVFFGFAAVQAFRAPSLLRGALAIKILFTYVPIFFLVYHNPPRSRRQLQIVLWAVFVVSAITAVYGLYQYQHFGTTLLIREIEGQQVVLGLREGQLRIASTFAHSTIFSLYISLVITLIVSLLLVSSTRARVVLLVIVALLVIALPLTLSRVGWVGLGLGLATLALLAPGRHRRALFVLLLVVSLMALLFLSPKAARRTATWSFTGSDASFTGRASLIYWAYRMTFVEIPWGCGLGTQEDSAVLTSRVTKQSETLYPCLWRGHPVTGADTVALNIGVQMGAIGYILFFLIHLVLWRQGIAIFRRLQDPFLKALGSGLLGYLAIMTFSNFYSGTTTSFPVQDLYFWAFSGLLLSLGRIECQWLRGAEAEGS